MKIKEMIYYLEEVYKQSGVDADICLVSEEQGFFRFDLNIDVDLIQIEPIEPNLIKETVLGIWVHGLVEVKDAKPTLSLVKSEPDG